MSISFATLTARIPIDGKFSARKAIHEVLVKEGVCDIVSISTRDVEHMPRYKKTKYVFSLTLYMTGAESARILARISDRFGSSWTPQCPITLNIDAYINF